MGCFKKDMSKIYEKARKFLRDAGEGGELLDRAEEYWRKGEVRMQVMMGNIGVDALLDADDIAGYNWFRLYPGMIAKKENNNTAGGK